MTSSLPVAGHQAPVQHTPSNDSAGRTFGGEIHLIKPAGSASRAMSFEYAWDQAIPDAEAEALKLYVPSLNAPGYSHWVASRFLARL